MIAAAVRLHGIPGEAPSEGRNLVAYRCQRCEPPVAPRAWPPFRATCDVCGTKFVRADGRDEDGTFEGRRPEGSEAAGGPGELKDC